MEKRGRRILMSVTVSLFSVGCDTMSLPSAGSERSGSKSEWSIGITGIGDQMYRGCASMIDCSYGGRGRPS